MSNDRPAAEDRSNAGLWVLMVLISVVVGLQALGAYLEVLFFKDWEERSQFGEAFGSINTLFSGLAFAGVIYTILLQKHELELQRREVRMTRTEFERSATAQEKSERVLALTARLNALHSLAEAASRKLDGMRKRGDQSLHTEPVRVELEDYLRRIKECLREMEDLSATAPADGGGLTPGPAVTA